MALPTNVNPGDGNNNSSPPDTPSLPVIPAPRIPEEPAPHDLIMANPLLEDEDEDQFHSLPEFDETPAPVTPAAPVPPPAPPVQQAPPVPQAPVAPPVPQPAPAAQPTPQPVPTPAPQPVAQQPIQPPQPVQPAQPPAQPSRNFIEDEPTDFIDKKNKKLIPFGGKKSKPVSADKFDDRENRKKKAKAVQVGVLALLVGTTGFGIWNAVNPPQGASLDDVYSIVAANDNDESFPFERGAAFSENFIEAFLERDTDTSTRGYDLTNYFYTGSMEANIADPRIEPAGNSGQRLLTTPKVVDQGVISGTDGRSAYFVVAAFVETLDLSVGTPTDDVGKRRPVTKWLVFNVNVFFDKKTDKMYVTPNSPILVPTGNVGASAELPEAKKLGTGEQDSKLATEVKSVVQGYLSEFAKASASKPGNIVDYVPEKPKVSLVQGLAGEFTFESPTDPEASISFQAFYALTDSEEPDPNTAKVDVTVRWKDATSPAPIVYTSEYLMTLEKQPNKKWLVTDMFPRRFAPVEKD